MRRPLVVLGIPGSTLDSGIGPERWERWRPTVAISQHEDLLIDRFILLSQPRDRALADRLAEDLATVSPETTVERHSVSFRDPWDFEEVFGALADFARGYPFDPDREDYLLHITTGTHVVQICLFLLAEARFIPARLLQAAPPSRRSQSGPGSYRIIDLDLSRYDSLAQRFAREQQEGLSFLKAGIDTHNANFNRLIERIERVAITTTAPILLTGPTGAGKSRLARRIYDLKSQRHQVRGPFVEVNCATLRGDGAMSALFGHRRGAFTGAVDHREGLLRSANGGILFLDEIGELRLEEQAMLLRAVEERRFLPVGSDREVESDFQLFAGTNRDLVAEVHRGTFRADLLARIDLWTFELPGLRDRLEDLEPNLDWEIDQAAQWLCTRLTISREARQQFLDFARAPEASWRGNFRDLNGAVTRMATLAHGGRITATDVDEETQRLRTSWRDPRTPADSDNSLLAELMEPHQLDQLDLFDRVQLAAVIRICRRSPTLAAAGRTLFAASRQQRTSTNDADRLRKYLIRFGLSFTECQLREHDAAS